MVHHAKETVGTVYECHPVFKLLLVYKCELCLKKYVQNSLQFCSSVFIGTKT